MPDGSHRPPCGNSSKSKPTLRGGASADFRANPVCLIVSLLKHAPTRPNAAMLSYDMVFLWPLRPWYERPTCQRPRRITIASNSRPAL